MDILVTGGAGFIGSHTVVELIKEGYTPIILDTLENSEAFIIDRLEEITGQKLAFYKGDCRDAKLVEEILNKHAIKGVIHFAAYKSVGESVKEPFKYFDNNINSLLTIVDECGKKGIKNLIFSSSCTVYGQPDKLPVTEATPFKPANSPYGRSKQICEFMLQDLTNEVNTISLRYFNPIGAHESSRIGELPVGVPDNLVPYITQTAAGLREQLTVFGDDYDTPDGTCIRDYIHVTDLAIAHIHALKLLLEEGLEGFHTFNVGTGNGNTVMELVKGFMEATGVDLNYKLGARRPGDVEKIYADVSHAEDTLKWKATRDIKKSLLDAWNWQVTLK